MLDVITLPVFNWGAVHRIMMQMGLVRLKKALIFVS